MEIFERIQDLRNFVKNHKKQGKSIGFVPTMGALHEGHASLYKKSKAEQDISIASIFVNPTQFGPNEDFAKYPRTFDADVKILTDLGVDALFFPSVDEMYPIQSTLEFNFPEISSKLCGKSRPTHFQGVLQVVMKLFNIVQPDVAYFGQKDFQQTVLIRTMCREFHLPLCVEVCPTLRENSGLAMSSRNRYLSEIERDKATVLYKILQFVKNNIETKHNIQETLDKSKVMLVGHPEIKLDYLEIYQVDQLKNVDENSKNNPLVVAIAAWIGNTRLIDNLLIN